MTAPVFTAEGPRYYAAAYRLFRPFSIAGPYQTDLGLRREIVFRDWVRQNHVPFDVGASIVDYDMRGFWSAMVSGQEPYWHGGHFPDTYKTPYDTTFSRESKYATSDCPFVWRGDITVDRRTGRVIFAPPGWGSAAERVVNVYEPSAGDASAVVQTLARHWGGR